jgi:hypothetical protein
MDKQTRAKKINWRGSQWELYCGFADEITYRILNNIIFNYSVGDSIGEFTLKFWISHKIFK